MKAKKKHRKRAKTKRPALFGRLIRNHVEALYRSCDGEWFLHFELDRDAKFGAVRPLNQSEAEDWLRAYDEGEPVKKSEEA